MDKLQFHELANIFPMMVGDEYKGLVDSIRKGYDPTMPIVMYEGKILDGRNRYIACVELGIVAPVVQYEGDDPLGYVLRHNLARRHLSESQRAVVASRLANMKQGERTDIEPSANLPDVISQLEAAKSLNVSDRLLRTVKEIEREAPEMIARIESGELTANKAITELKRKQNIVNLESISTKEIKAIDGVYDVIVIDPPWPMEKIERDVAPNQVAFAYPTMSMDELSQLNIPAHSDCHVFLWTTQKFLPAALDLLVTWGFTYTCTFVWHKPGGFQVYGLPQYNCEFALYARRGAPKFIDLKDFMTCFSAPRGEHSEKPEEFYATLRRVTGGRRLDMFNRRKIDGFDGWGNESA